MLAEKVISRVRINPSPFAPKGTNPNPKDNDYFKPFETDNFNLLEARPMRIDKTTTNANMEPIRVTEESLCQTNDENWNGIPTN